MGNAIDSLKQALGVVADLRSASAVLGWDQQTYMPPGGAEGRGLALSTLDQVAHDRFVAHEMGERIDAAAREVRSLDLDSDEARLVSVTRRLFDKERKVSSEWVAEFSRVTSNAFQAWQQAKKDSDFPSFRPHLEKVMALRRQYTDFFRPYDEIYDPLLDDFEPGMKTAQVRSVFETLRPQQVGLIHAIVDKGDVVDDSLLNRVYDESRQWDFGLEIAKRFGYDLERGRQDKSAHPFTTEFGHGDVRITTRIYPDDLSEGMFGTFHETGHALYGQGIRKEYARTPLSSFLSMAVHESQSRTWENIVGRSRGFWTYAYPRLQSYFPEQLGNVALEAFYRAVNKVTPSLIRTEADEATYNLHVMLRFEIETGLMEQRLEVADLPEIWNARMQEYLGVVPPDDRRGVLQDIHWSVGAVGYFPSYALGNLLAAQLWETVLQQIPDLPRQFERGEFGGLLAWQREHLHQFGGKFEPMELIEKATGSPLSPEPYLRYLRAKYGEIYRL